MKLIWKICWKYRRKWIKKTSHFAIPKIAVNDITIDNINENKEKAKESNRNNFRKQNNTNTKLKDLDSLNLTKFECVKIINVVNER